MENSKEGRLRDFEWALGLNRFNLRLMGLWPDEEHIIEDNPTEYLRVPLMITIVVFCLILPQMYALFLVIHELPLVIDNMLTSCPACISCLKLYFMWSGRRALRPAVQSATRDWLREKSDWEYQMMKLEAYRSRIFTLSSYILLGLGYMCFTVFPFMNVNIRIKSNITDYGERLMFVQSYYPYDYSKSPWWEISYVTQALSGTIMVMALSIPDNYFAALVFHTSGQFEILGAKFEHFTEKHDDTGKNLDQHVFRHDLGILIERHVHLMMKATDLEKAFSFVIGLQILCMSVMVICLGFQIIHIFITNTRQASVIQIVILISSLLSLMIYMLINCYASETLATQSAEIYNHVYNIRWYVMPERIMHDLIPVMVFSEYPRFLTAGKVINLSLASYCQILKTTIGYLSVLIAISGRENGRTLTLL